MEGIAVGEVDGCTDGITEGIIVGFLVGNMDGCDEGEEVGVPNENVYVKTAPTNVLV